MKGAIAVICGLWVGIAAAAAPQAPVEKIAQVIDVAPVWSGHPVGFALLTHHTNQFVAFYDDQRRMTVAARTLDSTNWHFVRLPQTLGWDSHNYITLAVDAAGHLHLSGNMHVHPLVYFRTRWPLDIESFEAVPSMIGNREKRCTYPRFLRGPANELIFTYRDGSSGNGDQIFNVHDDRARTWKRLLDQPLTSGEGLMNAYFVGPVRGPDGFFHLCWVWRDTGDCASNHDLSYARSRDLVHWENSKGQPLKLPITLKTAEVVDPVPAGGGIINGNTRIGFDAQGRPVLSYHKFDGAGKTQLYNARLQEGRWQIHQTSDWDYRWEFSGGGSITFEIGFGPVQAGAAGQLTQSFHHAKHGSGLWVLDAKTLKPVERWRPASPFAGLPVPAGSRAQGLQTRSASDLGDSGEPGVRYVLRWETLPSNRDRPRPGPPPPPSQLRLCKLAAAGAVAPGAGAPAKVDSVAVGLRRPADAAKAVGVGAEAGVGETRVFAVAGGRAAVVLPGPYFICVHLWFPFFLSSATAGFRVRAALQIFRKEDLCSVEVSALSSIEPTTEAALLWREVCEHTKSARRAGLRLPAQWLDNRCGDVTLAPAMKPRALISFGVAPFTLTLAGVLLGVVPGASGQGSRPAKPPPMHWGDTSRLGRPFAKDPSVIKWRGRYLMFYSVPAYRKDLAPRNAPKGWAIGIAESKDLKRWAHIGDVLPQQDCEQNGLVNGRIILLDGKLHLFYNTYGNDAQDALCHATSTDGLRFTRDPSNPVWRPTGAWNNGRAIDVDVVEWGDQLIQYYATRDPAGKVQMLHAIAADRKSDFSRSAWKSLTDGPILKPELPWETNCIEAPSVVKRGDTLFLFYGGGYNNDPQQIGCAVSTDAIHFKRLFVDRPLLANGQPGEWNSSESGHPGIFENTDGQMYLFYQGNNDNGRTWYISWVKLGWQDDRPFVMGY